MKKTILLILAILPIVLVIIIAFAGRILAEYKYIPVERVEFIDEKGTAYNDKMLFKVNIGEHKKCDLKVYPELATNKKVTYTSADESICTVDENGVILGQKYGFTTVFAKTDDGGKVAKVNVLVTADIPISITLGHEEITMVVGEQYFIEVMVDLPVALDKSVNFVSDNPDVVSVDPTGRLVAKSAGTAVITVKTVSGGLSATCTVTVVGGELPLMFDFKDAENIEKKNEVYITGSSSINLAEYLVLGEGVNMEDVSIVILGGSAASIENGVLTFSKSDIVTVRAYIGDDVNNPTAFADVQIAFR